MYKHYVLLATSFSRGTRIAYDYILNDNEDIFIDKDIKQINDICGYSVSIATQVVKLDSNRWEDLQRYDGFFDDTLKVNSINEFANILKEDKTLKAMDITKYILSKYKCTHLKLQKLLYYCYADYLCLTGKKLFDDNILAYQYGPVIESIYKKYKHTGSGYLQSVREDNKSKPTMDIEDPSRSRILASINGIDKLLSINKTIASYIDIDVWDIVGKTHLKGTPWDIAYHEYSSNIITDDLILKYHYIEK